MPIPIEQQIAAVAREIAMRKNVYPKWVANGRMKQEKAEHEIAAMEAVIETIKRHRAALAVVKEQAEDEGCWMVAEHAPEAYLQQELRRLHAAVEVKQT